jgi:hypothetical protein
MSPAASPSRGSQRLRQVGGGGHRRRADKDRDDQHVVAPAESRRDLQANVVIGVIQPTPGRLILDCQPYGPDHGQQRLTRANLPLKYAGEPLARVDGVDVPKHLFCAEMMAQRVPEASRVRPTVLPPITDEDALPISARLPFRGFRLTAMACPISNDHSMAADTHEYRTTRVAVGLSQTLSRGRVLGRRRVVVLGELVQATAGKWVTHAPTHCPNVM